MKSINFWGLIIKKETFILNSINFLFKIKSFLSYNKNVLLKKNKDFSVNKSQDLLIVLNGPSIKNQDFSLLKEIQYMFVNRGFKHPLFRDLKPKYHTIVDPKFLTGEWPVSWLDEIVDMVPDITFLMPVSWAFKDVLKPYMKKGFSFYWLPDENPCTLLGVAGSCFKFGIQQRFKNIYFTGFDGNGLAHEVLKTTSHFYGVNDENLKKSTKNFIVDFYMYSRHLNDLIFFAEKCKKEKISITNVTDGGLLDMFPRKEFKELLK